MTVGDTNAIRDELILEGLVTTQSECGTTNVSPMGPLVDRGVTWLRLRPFKTSRTYANLRRSRRGIFHVTDDVELLARAAIGRLASVPPLQDCSEHGGKILTGACRWYAFRVDAVDDTSERSQLDCRVLGSGRLRDFLGWNRAQHAVLEAAILATRIHLYARQSLNDELRRLDVIIGKTGGLTEKRAFHTIVEFVEASPNENFGDSHP